MTLNTFLSRVLRDYLKWLYITNHEQTHSRSFSSSNHSTFTVILESAKKTDVVFRLLFAPLRHVKNFGDFCACGESKVTASVEIS
jgi:hypothetical protein